MNPDSTVSKREAESFEKAVGFLYEKIREPIDEDGFRFIMVIQGVSAFLQDYDNNNIWNAAHQVRNANPNVNTKEAWISCLYGEVATLLDHNGPITEKVVLIQQCMLISLVVSLFEPLVFENGNMRQTILLVNPPPGQDAMRYYMDAEGLLRSKELIQTFLERKGATLQ